MVRASHIISGCLGAVMAKEDCASMADGGQLAPGVGQMQFQVFDGDIVGQGNGGIQVFSNKNMAMLFKGGAGNISPV